MEVDAHYDPLASETGACKPVQRATQCASARYGTRRAVLSWRPLPEGACRQLSAGPSHSPSDPTDGLKMPHPVRRPIFFFRKIILYGKTKKSTHARTTPRPLDHPLLFLTGKGRIGYPAPTKRTTENRKIPTAPGAQLSQPPETTTRTAQTRLPCTVKAAYPVPRTPRDRIAKPTIRTDSHHHTHRRTHLTGKQPRRTLHTQDEPQNKLPSKPQNQPATRHRLHADERPYLVSCADLPCTSRRGELPCTYPVPTRHTLSRSVTTYPTLPILTYPAPRRRAPRQEQAAQRKTPPTHPPLDPGQRAH